MTQKILFAISAVLIIAAIVAIIVTNKPKVSDKLITISTEYNYVYTEQKRLNFKIYSNKLKHKIHFDENISYVYLENTEQTNRFELELIEITYSHEEKYLGDTYYAYNYSFVMPRLESNLLIEDANLSLTLANGVNYLLPIGTFRFLYYPDVGIENSLKITGLYGYKQEGSDYSRLAKILIEHENDKSFSLNSISIDGEHDLDYLLREHEIEVVIPYQKLALNHAPIILTITKEGSTKVQVIDNFQFFNDYNILETSGDLINVYHAN